MRRAGRAKSVVLLAVFALLIFSLSAPLRSDGLNNLSEEQRVAAERVIDETSICSSTFVRVRSFELNQKTNASWNVSCGPSVLSFPSVTEKVQCLDGVLLVEWLRDEGPVGPCPSGIESLYRGSGD